MTLRKQEIRQEYGHLLWPLLVEQLFMMLIGNVNVYIFSLYNDQVVAAIGLADQVLVIGTMAMGIVSLGSTILFLQNADHDRLAYFKGVARQTILLNFLLGLFVMVVAWLGGNMIMGWMQTPTDIKGLSVTYFRLVSMSLVFQALSTSASALLRSYGHSKVSMRLSMMNTFLTIGGNLLVIFLPAADMTQRITWIGWMTILTRLVGASLSAWHVKQNLPQVWDGLFDFRQSDLAIGRRILALGIPSGMENVSYNVSQTMITAIIASLGTVEVSARIYTQTITAIVFALSVAGGQAGQVIIGKLSRKKAWSDTIQFSLDNTKVFMAVGFVINVVIALAGPLILRLFTQNTDIIAIAQTLLWMNALYDPCRVGNEIIIASLNVMGEVRYPVKMAIIVTYLFTVPLCFLFGSYLKWGLPMIWLVFIIDEGFRLYAFIKRWKDGAWVAHHS